MNSPYDSLSGELGVERHGYIFMLDFPSQPLELCQPPLNLLAELSEKPFDVFKTEQNLHYYAAYDLEDMISVIEPNLMLLARLHSYGVVVTAPGKEADFVSRYFAPSNGIPEDPVTCSTHCALVPCLSRRINKTTLIAWHISTRGASYMVNYLKSLSVQG